MKTSGCGISLQSRGFTLLEVIIALTIVSSTMTLMVRWQAVAVRSALEGWSLLVRRCVLQEQLGAFLLAHSSVQAGAVERKKTSLGEIKVAAKSIDRRSSLARFANDLLLVRSSIKWPDEFGETPSEKRRYNVVLAQASSVSSDTSKTPPKAPSRPGGGT